MMHFSLVFLLVAAAVLYPFAKAHSAKETRSTLNGFGETVPRELRGSYGRNAAGRVQIWDNCTLVFDFNEAAFSAEEQEVIYEGIEELSALKCVLFKKRQDEVYFVNITRIDENCWSHVGVAVEEPAQKLNLGSNCIAKDIVVHELLHAIGIHHEHQRPCRDDYVTINWANIQQEYWFAFVKRPEEEEELVGIDYNYESIMHYETNAFAINTSIPTIIPKQPGVTLGGIKLSQTDKEKVERLYKCINVLPGIMTIITS